MKFSPNISFQPNDKISFGLGVHIDYSSLDLGSGSSFNYGIGAQLGVLYKPVTGLSIGATYTTPQSVNHENVADFDQDGNFDDLKLESPQVVGLGIAVEPIQGTLLFEVDGKWINWENAEGYEDFDWQDQYVLGIGAQYKPIKKLSLRAGYNYGENPVKEHDNFNGGIPSRDIQGKTIPFNYYYETFRIIGFPAIVQNHITVGIGYEFSNTFAVNLGYMHAFEETISENGTAPDGVTPVTLESKLSEDSVDFGLTWRF
jgi:long-chain fatty acid transport protein